MPQHPPPRVAVIIVDSSEPALVERAMAEGWMPHLRRLRERGAYGRLAAASALVNASPWISFITGRDTGDHGVWNFLAWSPERMDLTPCDPAAQDYAPWWRSLCRAGRRCVVLDVPRTYPPAEPFDGVELSAWAAHYKLVRAYSHRSSFLDWVQREFGREPLGNEPGGDCLTAASVLAESRRVLEATRLQAELAVRALERERCELFMLALSGPHRAGHMCWDTTGLAQPSTEEQRRQINGLIRAVYSAADTALGRVLDQLEGAADTTILALSLHGMGQNTSLADMLPEMLDRVLHDRGPEDDEGGAADGGDATSGGGLLKRLRQAVPLSWRSAIKNRLPIGVQHWLTRFWRRAKVDWSRTPAFTLLPDLQGFIRINLKGREREGIVEPGAAYDELCAKIAAGLRTFVHADTGEPAVVDVQRADELFPGGTKLGELPDLIVQWSDRPACTSAGVRSDRYGIVPWPTPGRLPDGRSGHHRHEGWLAAAGPGIEPGSDLAGLHQFDIPPTLHALLGERSPEWMEGKVIGEITGRCLTGRHR